MTSNNQACIVYYLLLPHKKGGEIIFSNLSLALQEQRVQQFLDSHPEYYSAVSFIESPQTQRHRHHWPELKKAVDYCVTHHCHLIIAEIGNLVRDESFIQPLLSFIDDNTTASTPSFKTDLYCCDQPFINRGNFLAFSAQAKQKKILHGQLIKAGLSRTTAKSGNPHAAEIINQVNKPKIENAILFALLLQPIVAGYQAHNFAQRKMVAALNKEGFMAPEGGCWVLSQLQKVLERIKFNETALKLQILLEEYHRQGIGTEQIAANLNNQKLLPLCGKEWTVDLVVKLKERLEQIISIINLNDFIIEILPLLEKHRVDEFNDKIFKEVMKQTEQLDFSRAKKYIEQHPELSAVQIVTRLQASQQYQGLLKAPKTAEHSFPLLTRLYEQQHKICTNIQQFLTPSYNARVVPTISLQQRPS